MIVIKKLQQYRKESLNNLSKEDLVNIVIELYGVIQDLEDKVSINSKNSGKPPSSDGYNKPDPKSRRVKTGKTIGGQRGHIGTTLERVDNPDLIELYKVVTCEKCGANLEKVLSIKHECRQEFDIIKPKTIIVEHRAEVKLCTSCLHTNIASFPKHIKSLTQYGANVRGYAIYLNQYQLIPFKRLQEMFKDCFSLSISQGSLANFNTECADKLTPALELIKDEIINSKVAHFDETSMRINGETNWLHVASTKHSTYYDIHTKRGNIAMDKIGILPKIRGIAIHDYWKPYMRYFECKHALCNAHHLRELEFIYERGKNPWAKKMSDLLLEINTAVTQHKQQGKTKLSDIAITAFEKNYKAIMSEWCNEEPHYNRAKLSYIEAKSENLGNRFHLQRHLILRFMYDFNVEFTNNLAEQDIRMCKVKAKISGSFRSSEGSSNFVKIRSYISTLRKNKQAILSALASAFHSTPLSPYLYQ